MLQGDTSPGGGQGEGGAFDREKGARHRPADGAGHAGKGMEGAGDRGRARVEISRNIRADLVSNLSDLSFQLARI